MSSQGEQMEKISNNIFNLNSDHWHCSFKCHTESQAFDLEFPSKQLLQGKVVARKFLPLVASIFLNPKSSHEFML